MGVVRLHKPNKPHFKLRESINLRGWVPMCAAQGLQMPLLPVISAGRTTMGKIPTRERCQICHRVSPVGFHVPNDVWEAAMHRHWQNAVVCLSCFVDRADAQLVEWDQEIALYPVSLVTHLRDVVGLDTRLIERKL